MRKPDNPEDLGGVGLTETPGLVHARRRGESVERARCLAGCDKAFV